ncbi:TMEM175 family protein [Geothrix sp. PMB-07]|uniref:TMEM175 family protein n=1 Tax=Geothrix sp. PMB-07 TaxID=3068640 RepID=UPI0027426E0D|nr:TMEM175 family protein [Geothrix sp. PMB-07]WLT31859.1 TMEM175 family protein [Geothrix sp. PMB-07]
MADMPSHAGHRHGFALHRVEGFSDAVFAFAVTLLVVSLEVPKSAQELFHTLWGFLAFGICFAFLILIWFDHHTFFKRYPLTDTTTLVLNMALLFVVLLYVYPMKFLFTLLVNGMLLKHSIEGVKTVAEIKTLMVVYGVGFLTVNTVLFLMHLHAWRKREGLRLSPVQRLELGESLRRFLINALVALLSIFLARFTSDTGQFAGWCYALLAPAQTLNGVLTRRRQRAAETIAEA